MFDSAQSSILKVLRVPAPKEEPFEGPSELFQLHRHDHHNLDLKTHFELGNSNTLGELSVYMITPSTVQMHSFSKAELSKDFYSRLKLSSPQMNSRQDSAFDEALADFKENSDPSCIKTMGVLFEEHVRKRRHQHKKEMRLIHSLTSQLPQADKLGELQRGVSRVAEKAHEIRALCMDRKMVSSDYDLLEDYITHLMIDYLGQIRHEFELVKQAGHHLNSTQYRSYGKNFEDKMVELLKEEVRYHKDHAHILHDENARERHIVRINHLKKYFQSEMFIDIAQKDTMNKVSEPVAAIAAGFGAACAALAYYFYFSSPQLAGIQSMVVLVAGIFLYVLRDRMKDWGRKLLTDKLEEYLPDVEINLILRKQKVGEMKQFFSKGKKDLPPDIAELRPSSAMTNAEKHLHEHSICLKRQFEIGAVAQNNCSWALRETLRINLQRYLKFMDDPYKDLRVLNSDGELTSIRSHRVYYFYILLKAELLSPRPWWARILKVGSKGDAKATFFDAFRVVIDKNGIDRVESMNDPV